MDAGTPQAFYANIPPVTKFFVTAFFFCALGLTIGWIDVKAILFFPDLIIKKFQVFDYQ